MTINTSKLAVTAAVALATIGSPAFAAHRHHHYVSNRPVYTDYARNPGAHAQDALPASNPTDDPALTGGGSLGYNKCGGHPAC